MRLITIRKRYSLSVLIGVVIGVSVYGINSGWTKPTQGQKKELITVVPEIISCVQNIKLKKAEILSAGQPNAVVAVEVENMRDVGIIAITMTTRTALEAYTTSLRTGFEEGTKPLVVIEPHKTGILEMEVANIFKDQPLQIGSVMYADGTEEGCQDSLKRLHDVKEHEKKQKKGGSLR